MLFFPSVTIQSVPVQSDWLNSALSPVVYGDIALSINTQYKIQSRIMK